MTTKITEEDLLYGACEGCKKPDIVICNLFQKPQLWDEEEECAPPLIALCMLCIVERFVSFQKKYAAVYSWSEELKLERQRQKEEYEARALSNDTLRAQQARKVLEQELKNAEEKLRKVDAKIEELSKKRKTQ